jgi:hypothetical protein
VHGGSARAGREPAEHEQRDGGVHADLRCPSPGRDEQASHEASRRQHYEVHGRDQARYRADEGGDGHPDAGRQHRQHGCPRTRRDHRDADAESSERRSRSCHRLTDRDAGNERDDHSS